MANIYFIQFNSFPNHSIPVEFAIEFGCHSRIDLITIAFTLLLSFVPIAIGLYPTINNHSPTIVLIEIAVEFYPHQRLLHYLLLVTIKNIFVVELSFGMSYVS